MKPMDELILAYFSDEASATDVVQLFHWVRETPENAKEFARTCALHANLRDRIRGERQALESGESVIVPRVASSVNVLRQRRMRAAVVLAIAACLVLGVGLSFWFRDRQPAIVEQTSGDKSFVTIAQSADTQWANHEQIRVGDRMSRKVLHLKSGIVRLLFDDGVEITLEGPADYELIAPGKTRLTSGLLTATAPAGAEGFRVDTPFAHIVDLGTAFGIDLRDASAASVSVFDGEVEVTPMNTKVTQLLKEGESVLLGADGSIKTGELDTSRFEKLWPISSGIVGSTGAFRFAPQWPLRLRLVESDTEIFVVPEGYTTKLARSLKVDIVDPGEYRRESELVEAELPSGTRVKSYLLQFNPVNAADRKPLKRIFGDITFDGRVLGLIVLGEELRASDAQFSLRPHRGPQRFRTLELTGNSLGDVVSLSADRHRVTLDLAEIGVQRDHVRVIVEASIDQSTSLTGQGKNTH